MKTSRNETILYSLQLLKRSTEAPNLGDILRQLTILICSESVDAFAKIETSNNKDMNCDYFALGNLRPVRLVK